MPCQHDLDHVAMIYDEYQDNTEIKFLIFDIEKEKLFNYHVPRRQSYSKYIYQTELSLNNYKICRSSDIKKASANTLEVNY